MRKGSGSREIWAYNGSSTAMPNEIKLLKYNLLIVEVPRQGAWILGAQIVHLAIGSSDPSGHSNLAQRKFASHEILGSAEPKSIDKTESTYELR